VHCSCTCIIDGFGGDNCDEYYEMTCLNQCSGHGECYLGFCKCHEGWYGTDCAQRVEGKPDEPGEG
jgi:EGF-like domain